LKPVKNLITIDGPSGVGKGTLAFSLAEKLGWNVLDSGLIYRLVGYITLEEELKTSNEITRFINNSEIELLTNFKKRICEIKIDSKLIGDELRNEEVASKASELAKNPKIRKEIVQIQRKAYDEDIGLIADGRDMGTVIFPEAILKVFLQASPEIRAKRRAKQLKEKGMNVIMHDLLELIKQRDEEDTKRKFSPLKQAEEALMIDTTNLSIKEVEDKVLEYFERL